MRINIAVPHYNQSGFLSEALDSIIQGNGADDHQIDLTVIDDGSDSREVEEAMRITLGKREDLPPNTTLHWLAQTPNQGSAVAINEGHRSMGESDWMTWCSSDNVYCDGWLGDLLALADEKAGAVYGDFIWTKPGARTFMVGRDYDPEYLINHPHNCYIGPAFIIRSHVWESAGPHVGWNAHDYGHWLRVEEACWEESLRIRRVAKPLCTYLAHSERATERRKGSKWQDAERHQQEAIKRRNK